MAQTDDLRCLSAFSSMLESDHLITITVGLAEHSKTFRLQRSILLGLSTSGVFSALLDSDCYDAPTRELERRFDDVKAWETLLYWKVNGRMLDMTDWNADVAIQHLVSCWLLGEQYDIRTFQNVVMIKLLHITAGWKPSALVLRLVFQNTRPSSKLCLLMAQVTARHLLSTGEDSIISQINLCEGSKDFMAVILKVMTTACSGAHPPGISAQVCWTEYMVAEGLGEHRVFDNVADE